MADSVNVCIRFNGGNPQLFKIGYINVMLKGLKDQLNEINQGLNLGDTRRVENIWYERPTLDEGKIWFSRLELTNDDDHFPVFEKYLRNANIGSKPTLIPKILPQISNNVKQFLTISTTILL
ncbi:40S ribosomal S10-like protein, putative [Medicago truncatula]|uniref:40S ribosomal S10-like protein, putative n=1 Tax=Medicago truncatula TaxID=3880 RepID=G7KY44_MEDTR|nr:40S ribosomal S10-like protein, putative [Medicago truncatula]